MRVKCKNCGIGFIVTWRGVRQCTFCAPRESEVAPRRAGTSCDSCGSPGAVYNARLDLNFCPDNCDVHTPYRERRD